MKFIDAELKKFEKQFPWAGNSGDIGRSEADIKEFLCTALANQKLEILRRLPKHPAIPVDENDDGRWAEGYNRALTDMKKIVEET